MQVSKQAHNKLATLTKQYMSHSIETLYQLASHIWNSNNKEVSFKFVSNDVAQKQFMLWFLSNVAATKPSMHLHVNFKLTFEELSLG